MTMILPIAYLCATSSHRSGTSVSSTATGVGCATYKAATLGRAAEAGLSIGCVEGHKVVVVVELRISLDVVQSKQSHAVLAGHGPLLHFAVGFAAVIDEPRHVAATVRIDDAGGIDVQTVVMLEVRVVLGHASLKFGRTHHFAYILYNELSFSDGKSCEDGLTFVRQCHYL